MRFAVFLRAMNVGVNRIPVGELRDRISALGFTDVASHLHTGNLAVTDPARRSQDAVAEAVEADLLAAGMVKMDAMVRTGDELRGLLAAVDVGSYPQDEWRRCVTFLRRPPGRDGAERMTAKGWTVLHADDRTVVSVFPRTIQGYAVNLDTAWKTPTTTRWWNVVEDVTAIVLG